MSTKRRNTPRLAVLAGLGLVGAAGACSTVSPEEMDTGLAALRTEMMREMQAGDERLGNRIGAVEQRLAALESELREMEREFQVTVQRLEEELRFNVPVYFGFDSAELPANASEILGRFASVAQRYYPEALVTVEGFTDPSGPAAYNRQLGQRRADAVRQYLVEGRSFPDTRIRSVSYGEDTSRLIAPEGGPGQAGWQNRRVILVIDHQGALPATTTDQTDATE